MSAWLALADQPLTAISAPAGDRVLSAWPDADRRPHPLARRVDPRILDPDGPPAQVSLLWPDRDRLPLFDDPAVLQARRSALRLPAPRAVSTLTVDATHFAGSLWAADDVTGARADPFRLVGPVQVLSVGAGLLGRAVTLVGPAVERYRGAPWPSGSF